VETTTLSLIITLVLGTIVLFFGLRLFWLYVGSMGFAIGFAIGQVALENNADWIRWVLALALGAILAVLAILLQKPMAAIAGFIALGGSAAIAVSVIVEDYASWLPWVALAVGGLIGAVLAWVLFVPGVIFLTSLSGAASIVGAIESRWGMNDILFLVFWLGLAAAGMVVQVMTRRSDQIESQLTGSRPDSV
jgi:hypothetical protein